MSQVSPYVMSLTRTQSTMLLTLSDPDLSEMKLVGNIGTWWEAQIRDVDERDYENKRFLCSLPLRGKPEEYMEEENA